MRVSVYPYIRREVCNVLQCFSMKDYTDLDVWNVGMELVREIYKLTKKFPKEELYGLTAQIKRSATSILANIAEGAGRFTYPDKAGKYIISRGECSETEAFLLIAIELQFMTRREAERALALCQRERQLLSGLITSCRKHTTKPGYTVTRVTGNGTVATSAQNPPAVAGDRKVRT